MAFEKFDCVKIGHSVDKIDLLSSSKPSRGFVGDGGRGTLVESNVEGSCSSWDILSYAPDVMRAVFGSTRAVFGSMRAVVGSMKFVVEEQERAKVLSGMEDRYTSEYRRALSKAGVVAQVACRRSGRVSSLRAGVGPSPPDKHG
ncbi:uncharacterized protein M421DRAFT_88186 [Didymella exigua CBS 183.55]|uniref:Uncharacterized protein n=1 Tax=Didymella exigua CBS 183.55 TaxID=1150837 RepID=A0A6A5S2N4_9PLEO|nr:uncharacterized protein M421DRAFT_88186 [Didymella exigua CBS 183.55]KAF1934173.1 hypothetical protein M421DRAFT_88186 [Didymella exigua CBS 183.55]